MRLPFRLVQALLAVLLCVIAGQARAACTWNLNISPPLPTSISATQTVGNVVYSGVVTITTSNCTGSSSVTELLVFQWGYAATAIAGMSGLTVERNSFSGSALCKDAAFVVNSNGPSQLRVTINVDTNPCTLNVQLGLLIKASATTVSGTFPSPLVVGNPLAQGNTLTTKTCGIGWVYVQFNRLVCTSYTSSGVTTPVVASNTCTVSTPSVAVPLPNVSKTSLASVGATAGLTPFTLSFTGCSTSAGGFTGTPTWAFTPGPAANVISNGGTAANVYAQILDDTMTPITNGGTTPFSVPAAGGAVTRQFYARYYSGGNGGAGTLNSTATFTMTYN